MKMKQQIKGLTARDVYVPEHEYIKKSDRVNSAGYACYVERNYWIVDESDFSTLYLNFQEGKNGKKSGTYLAYQNLLKKKNVKFLNLYLS